MTEKIEKTSEEVAASAGQVSKKNRDSLFGTLLLLLLSLFVIILLAAVGFGAYRLWEKQAVQSEAPSIAKLGEMELADTPEASPAADEQALKEDTEKTSVTPEVLTKAQATEVSILNGGGARGIAGQASEVLKAAGFTKLSVGSTVGDFTGTTVYYGAGLEKEAQAVQEKLSTKYSSVTLKPAETANKETSTKPLTVIFGK